MNIAARTKRTLAVLTVIVVVAGIGFVATMYLILRDAEHERPWLHAYANGHTIEVTPYKYCELPLSDNDCYDGEISTIAVPPGEDLVLSLPTDIADAPWHLLAVYAGPDGTPVEREQQHVGGGTSAIVIPGSIEEPPMQLVVAEFSVIGGIDEDGVPVARGVWSIKNSAAN